MIALRRFSLPLLLATAPPALAQGVDSVPAPACLARTAGISALESTQRSPATRDTLPHVALPSAVATADSARAPLAVMVLAEARAKEVTFAKQPELRVRLCGGVDSVRVVERRNLPSPVVTGRTYRDVYVAVEIFGRLNADCITAPLTGRDSTAAQPCASIELTGRSNRPPETPERKNP